MMIHSISTHGSIISADDLHAIFSLKWRVHERWHPLINFLFGSLILIYITRNHFAARFFQLWWVHHWLSAVHLQLESFFEVWTKDGILSILDLIFFGDRGVSIPNFHSYFVRLVKVGPDTFWFNVISLIKFGFESVHVRVLILIIFHFLYVLIDNFSWEWYQFVL